MAGAETDETKHRLLRVLLLCAVGVVGPERLAFVLEEQGELEEIREVWVEPASCPVDHSPWLEFLGHWDENVPFNLEPRACM